MKPAIAGAIALLCVFLMPGLARAQANTSLSNLAATAVNADLNPGTDSSLNLGSATKNWKQIYFKQGIYKAGTRFISTGSGTGVNNLAIGSNTLAANSTGYNNTAVGTGSLAKNNLGRNNAAFGSLALTNSTTGSENIAFGHAALLNNTHGSSNVAIGAFSLNNNFTGNANIAIGSRALNNNRTGSQLVAIGDSSLFTATGTSQSVAVGSKALYGATGTGNTGIGYQALYGSGTGSNNTATGYLAMHENTTGSSNTAIGSSSLYSNTTGTGNVSIGNNTFIGNKTGNYNTIVGSEAFQGIESGNYNVAVGAATGTSGAENCTFIGALSQAYASSVISNSTVIGSGATVAASNSVVVGNSAVTSIGGAVNWSVISDARFKKDVQANVPGLEFIKQLRPVTYHYDPVAIRNFQQARGGAQLKKPAVSQASLALQSMDDEEKAKMLFTGFIAQEVEATAKKMNYEFSGVDAPKSDQDYYGLRLGDFIAPMVQGIKQLSDSNDAKTVILDSQSVQIDSLEARLARVEALLKMPDASGVTLTEASLGQNFPNPFRQSTAIQYTLPQRFGRAEIQITDMNGKIIRTIPVSGSGKGTLTVNAATLASGAYAYALYVDEKLIGTKQMLLGH